MTIDAVTVDPREGVTLAASQFVVRDRAGTPVCVAVAVGDEIHLAHALDPTFGDLLALLGVPKPAVVDIPV